MTTRSDWTIPLALAAATCLVAMVAITAVTGVSQETFEIVRRPAVYAAELRAHPVALRALFGIDTAFLVLYSAMFLYFARAIATPETRSLLLVGIGAVFATAVLDMIEDHHILAMLYGAEDGTVPSAGQLAFQHTLSQVKFNMSYLGQFLLGLAIPLRTRGGAALAILLTIGTLIQGIWLYAAPLALLPSGNFGRWIGFLIGFVLVIQVVRQRASAAVATSAPA